MIKQCDLFYTTCAAHGDGCVKEPTGESWTRVWVLSWSPFMDAAEIELDGGELTDDQRNEIYKACGRMGQPIRPAGSSNPGCAFADEPWIEIFPQGRVIIVRQTGGLDV